MEGSVIRYMRRALYLSQTELAEKVGVDFSTIARAERNRQKPNMKTMRKLQQALGFSEEDVLEIKMLLSSTASAGEIDRKHAELTTKIQRQARLSER